MAGNNIILTGFMGTGKSTAGRILAEQLGWTFVDLDERIARSAGKAIPAIFAEDGEQAFRDLETDACRSLVEESRLVVATGGGAVLRAANREALEAAGTVICLEAASDAILQRVGKDAGRPMLGHPQSENDLQARIATLLEQRAPAYALAPHHVNTTSLTPDEVTQRILAITANLPEGARRLPVPPPASEDHGYDILIAEGLLHEAGSRLIAAGIQPGRCAVITNRTLAEHHLPALEASLAAVGFEPVVLLAPDGEAHKNLATVGELLEGLATAKLARNEPVIALGGGVIGDTAGFVAATWLRGAPFAQIPTTLLAMVDSSVGGKVGVDLPQGKNLVGAFKQPALVLIDPDTLRTLPPAEFRSGLAEVVKAGIIGDPQLFRELQSDGPASLPDMIGRAVRVKADIVRRDPYERGDRAWLNLGHTFGHALELYSNFSLRHGEAVSIGMVAAAALSERIGACDGSGDGHGLTDVLAEMLARLGLPTSYSFDEDAVLAGMGTDKKRRGRSLRFVVIERIGKVRVADHVAEDDVRSALSRIQRR
ncbi:MAG: 3-dehydroquinate synthase [Anaerolineae bacterium]|nr:3-dehydroquinate synthase [Anaerolineae bacterium]